MKLIAFNNQLALIPQDSDSSENGEGGEETQDQDQDQTEEEGEGSEEGETQEGSEEDQTEEEGEGEGSDEGSDGEGEEEDEGDGEEGKGDADGEGEEEGSEDGEEGSEEGSKGEGEGYEGSDGETQEVDLRELQVPDIKREEGEASAGGKETLDLDSKEQREALAEMLENIMGQMEDSKEEDLDLKGHNEAFTEHFEESAKGDLRDNESYWRPWNPAKDKVQVARKGSTDVAKRYQANIKREVAAISTKLRSKFLIARQPQVQHGVRKGSGLSDRRLVDSTVELRSGRRATRPDWNKVNKGACTLAVGVVIDQSGSMGGINQVYAAQGAMAIAEPLDKLGAPVMVCGPRSGRWSQGDTWEEQREMDAKCGYNGDGTFHRSESVNIDLFKNWDERFNKCRDRFSTVSATGGTPLSDGIQYAMQELSDRTEVHRVIIVLTDGAANSPKVVNRQIRLAKEAGITVIGVGIGGYCGIVRTQFPANHIEIPDVKELPKKLLGMLENIMFPKRAKRAKMDGRIG